MRGPIELKINPADLKIFFMAGETKEPRQWVGGKPTEDQKKLTLNGEPAFKIPATAILNGTAFLDGAQILAGNAVGETTPPGTALTPQGAVKVIIRPQDQFSTAVTVEIEKVIIPGPNGGEKRP